MLDVGILFLKRPNNGLWSVMKLVGFLLLIIYCLKWFILNITASPSRSVTE